jgi:hypothetical protein
MSRERKRQCPGNPLRECTLLYVVTSGGCYCLHRSITGFGSQEGPATALPVDDAG